MYIMAPEPISTANIINPSHQSVYPAIDARQRLGKNITAADDGEVVGLMRRPPFTS
jgi:hypothetical protein